MKPLLALMLLATQACPQAIPTSSFNFFSYNATKRPSPPNGAMFQLNFPTQKVGSQDVLANCHTFGNLIYQWYAYGGGVWVMVPDDAPVVRSFTTYFQNSSTVTFQKGMEFNISMTGKLATNAAPSQNNFQQAWFWGSSQCFEDGPEIGFTRVLFNPGNASEESRIQFYYGTNVNCYTVASLSSCRSRSTGASIAPQVSTQFITLPTGLNSKGGTNWIYNVTIVAGTQFVVRIQDPYTLLDAVPVTPITIDPYFLSYAADLFDSGLAGYDSITQVRASVVGGLTEQSSNPLRIVTYGVKMK